MKKDADSYLDADLTEEDASFAIESAVQFMEATKALLSI